MYASEWLPYGVAFAPAGLGMVLDPFATPSDGARAVAVTLQTEAKKLFELSAVHNTVSVVPNSAQLGVRGPMVSLNLGTGLLNGSVSLSNGKFFKRVSLQGVLLQGENERALGSGLTSDGRRFVLEDATPFRGMVSVQGGVLTRNSAPLPAVAVVESFQIGKYEVTWNLWKEVRDWAVTRGYDLGGAGAGSGENHPVRNVNWYQAISWCNARSEKEGLTPVYELNGSVYRGGYGTVTLKSGASGYRLPTQTEWEWAARGGNESTGSEFSGGDDLGALGWYRGNSQGAEVGLEEGGVGTWPVGMKAPNELGLFDMSGNVYEWCWDASGTDRFIRGGSWWEQDLLHCSVTYSRVYGAGTSGADTGLRVVRKLAP